MTTNHNIYCSITGPMSQDARVLLPKEQAVKKMAQRAHLYGNFRLRAYLTELRLEEDDCRSLVGDICFNLTTTCRHHLRNG